MSWLAALDSGEGPSQPVQKAQDDPSASAAVTAPQPAVSAPRLTFDSLRNLSAEVVAESATRRAGIVPSADCVQAMIRAGVSSAGYRQEWTRDVLREDIYDLQADPYFQANRGHRDQIIDALVAMAAEADSLPDPASHSIVSYDPFDDREMQEAIAASMGFSNIVDDEQSSDIQRAIQASLGTYLPPAQVEDVHFSAVDPPLKVGRLRLPVCHTTFSVSHFSADLCVGPLVHSGSLWLHCFGFKFDLRGPHPHVCSRRSTRACPSACFAHYDFVHCDAVCRLPALQQGSPFEGAGSIYNHNTYNCFPY